MRSRALSFEGPVRRERPASRAALIAVSLLAHAAFALLLARRPSSPRPSQPLPAAVAVTFVKPRPPVPLAAAPPRPPKPAALKTSRGPRAHLAAAALPPPPLAPPPAQDPSHLLAPAPAGAPARPIVLSQFTVSAVSGGVMGGTGTVPGGAPGGEISFRGGDGGEQVSQAPLVLNAGSVDIKRYYPPGALKAGFEGAVSLRLVIDVDGSIASASVTHDPGEGLGAAALRAIREFRFSAGRRGGERVQAIIPFVIRFVLD
jgi:TonB family protein